MTWSELLSPPSSVSTVVRRWTNLTNHPRSGERYLFSVLAIALKGQYIRAQGREANAERTLGMNEFKVHTL